jgi:adenylate kinase family enzyme
MERIVIVGSSGAGKSTLAWELARILDIKFIHLDRLFWKRDWEERNKYERLEILENLLFGEKQWIIDGNYLRFAEFHVNAADTIVFLDIFPLWCFLRILKRHRENHECFRRDIPEGTTDKISLLRLLKVLAFSLGGRRTIKQTLRNYENKQIYTLHSVKEVNEFLKQQTSI